MNDVITTVEEQTIVTTTSDGSVIETTQTEVIVAQGTSGPQGIPGPAGTNGLDGDKTFQQAFSGTNVTVTHNLNKYPSVSIFTSAGDEVEGAIQYLTTNQLQISFANSFSGTVICN